MPSLLIFANAAALLSTAAAPARAWIRDRLAAPVIAKNQGQRPRILKGRHCVCVSSAGD
jgi:hypothetical protein